MAWKTKGDMASSRPEGKPIALTGSTPVAVTPLTEQRRWDALRAVTHQQQHVAALPLADLRQVIEALGLDGAAGRLPEMLTRPCPSCGAASGDQCTNGEQPYERGHRYRREEIPPHRRVVCPVPGCEAPFGAPCKSGGGSRPAYTYSEGHRARRDLAEQQRAEVAGEVTG